MVWSRSPINDYLSVLKESRAIGMFEGRNSEKKVMIYRDNIIRQHTSMETVA